MSRKTLICLLATLFLITARPAEAQQPAKIPRIGYLSSTSASGSTRDGLEAFRLRLRELGYVEGQNIAIEYRYAEGNEIRLPELAAELVRLKPEVIVTSGTLPTAALKDATNSIPIVVSGAGDLGWARTHCQPCSTRWKHHGVDQHCPTVKWKALGTT